MHHAKIDIIDDLPPEDVAMLQALYSRSPKSVQDHLVKVRATGSGKFMSQYYVGYGHKSIGDCGTTSIFIEGLSMLAAKAIQQWPLYNGQEASTRYMDFSQAKCVFETPEEEAIQQRWMSLYRRATEELRTQMMMLHPMTDDMVQKDYDNAISARVFDVARGLLPAGTTTMVSWHTNLRQADDHLVGLRQHPLTEVADLANSVNAKLAAKYSNSFQPTSSGGIAQMEYHSKGHAAFTYEPQNHVGSTTPTFHRSVTPRDIPEHLRHLLVCRPPRTPLHREFDRFGQFDFSFALDFGSYRDLQRHRNGVLNMPELTPYHFSEWYLNQYSEDVQAALQTILHDLCALPATPHRQYAVPMGALVPCRYTCGLPQMLYLAELRSGPTVHPTLRTVAHAAVEHLKRLFPGISLHADTSPAEFSVKRGKQTIVEKPSPSFTHDSNRTPDTGPGT
jgi:thymidylate synthase ThyX